MSYTLLPIQGRAISKRRVRRDKRPLDTVLVRKGYLAVCNAAGFFTEATGAATEIVVGYFYETVDNSTGTQGGQYADIEYTRDREVTLMVNDTGTAVAITERERHVFILDAATATMNTAKTPGPICYDVTSEGVWVEILSRPVAA